MDKLLSPAQLDTSVCAVAVFLGATDAQVPAGATTDRRVVAQGIGSILIALASVLLVVISYHYHHLLLGCFSAPSHDLLR